MDQFVGGGDGARAAITQQTAQPHERVSAMSQADHAAIQQVGRPHLQDRRGLTGLRVCCDPFACITIEHLRDVSVDLLRKGLPGRHEGVADRRRDRWVPDASELIARIGTCLHRRRYRVS